VRERDADGLAPWQDEAQATGLRGFARGLLGDIDAVRAALTLPWSNGPAEGQINRLKLLKRQMYGRAKFDLLRSRVLHAA
jgi:transposase